MDWKKPPVEIDMSYAQSPPLVQDEWFTDPVPADAPLRNPDARAERRKPGPRTATVAPPRSFGRRGHEVAERPSVGRRFFRALARFVIFVSIGVGGTIAAQTETAKELLAAQAPTLAWVLSVAPAKFPVVAAPAQQVGASASDLDAVRRSVEQLAAKQDLMAKTMMAALQAVDEDIRQKLSSMPASQPQPAAAIPQPRSPQARVPSPAAQSAVPRPVPGAQTPLPAR